MLNRFTSLKGQIQARPAGSLGLSVSSGAG